MKVDPQRGNEVESPEGRAASRFAETWYRTMITGSRAAQRSCARTGIR